MKKILITGANSYIGQSLENWLEKSQGDYQVDTLDMINPAWKEYDFSPYNSIFHVAAIVHKNEKNLNQDLYDKVNRDLPIELATLAKKAGVAQFFFLSSMSVYGNNEEVITTSTLVKTIRQANGKKTLLTSIFNPILNQLTGIGQFNKLFGNLVYDQGLSQEAFDYNVVNFEESIRKSEGSEEK
ncbi:NAD-dependent epimerase/dehydratase family protein [Lactococcus cremoris]|uniref:NAD-dependent epimerase/dehydratase family protein n=1 Tax=Lactococcus lactis subsp. cremoris TaxID=1359 RepID=UPI0009BE9FC1|nr:NAD-dependent epimerase/dehydratase family protein [Lactococcus cremoris]ARE24926.1 NAD-dependent epimerase/dehydratase family protein [Lactococcus cremoris]